MYTILMIIEKLKEQRKEITKLKQEIKNLRTVLYKRKESDLAAILRENERMKEQLSLAWHDNEQLMFEVAYLQDLTKYITK